MSICAFVGKYRIFVTLVIVFFGFVFCPRAHSGVLEKIVQDFSPTPGYVIMVRHGEFIVDLDASKGLVKGDLLCVISPGEKIVHPVTGKVLGSLEEVKGVLKVTRIKQGFSHARSLEGSMRIKTGDPIRRYENVKAIFWDYTGKGKTLFLRLQDALAHMNWVEFDAAQNFKPKDPAPLPETELSLVFILTENKLQVRDPDFLILHEYEITETITEQKLWTYPKEQKVTKRHTISPAKKQAVTVEAKPLVSAAPVIKKREKTAGLEPVFQQSNIMEHLPGGAVVMADFLPYENGLLLATTDGHKIRVFKISNGISTLAEVDTPFEGQILFLSWWQPEPTEAPFLAVVNWSDNSPLGSIFSLKGKQLQLLEDNIFRFIGAFDADGDGRPETLLGQEYEPEEFFGSRIKELHWVGRKIEYKDPSIRLPRRFTVSGGLLSDLIGNERLEATFIRNKILFIYSGKDPLYKSAKQMGGSLSLLTYDVDPEAKNLMTNSVSFEVPPVVADLDGDGILEILAVASDRSVFGSSGISPGIKQTWLAVFKYRDGTFSEGTLGEKMTTPIQGLAVFDGKVLLVVSEPGSIFSKKGKSWVVELPLAQ